MVTIAREALETAGNSPERWAAIAARAAAWAQAAPLELRDAVVLLPFTELLPHARAAFMAQPGWMPRIETTRTLAAGLGPAPPTEAGQVSLNADVDALVAAELLRGQPWGAAWARRDARSFAHAVSMVVESAHALVRASAAWPAAERPARWAAARELLPMAPGPGGTERMLARVALEWGSLAGPPATDRLFVMQPSAFIAVQAGGADPLTQALLASATVPCLVIDTDASPGAPFAGLHLAPAAALRVCDSLEDEAQCAAAQVLEHLRCAEQPVALIAQDRQLVRRVRALLERQQVSLRDETGWTLSTTRAAAQLMALLRAARPDAATDDLLDWLKGGSAWLGLAEASAVGALEHACRRAQVLRVAGLRHLSLDGAAARLWAAVDALLAMFTGRGRAPLAVWVATLAEALRGSGALNAMSADDAGRQVLATLRLPLTDAAHPAWPPAAGAAVMSFDEFSAWVADTLEGASFMPARGPGDAPEQVVITPLARAMLRPFAAVVFPGADDAHLGVSNAKAGLIGDAQALAFSIPTAADQRTAQLLAFVQAMHSPRLTFFRRRVDGTEPLAASPLVERLSLALATRGEALGAWHDPRVERPVAPTPIFMTAPAAPILLPQQVSASAVEALRACPYRFFALRMLGLREADELDDEVEKRDYGEWLHAVLLAFHTARTEPGAVAAEVLNLHALADQVQLEKGLADADFLPFSASFAGFAPRYVAWLHERDADGARYLRGEDDITLQLPALGGVALHGVIDRIDHVRDPMSSEGGAALQLIDYKTGSASALRDKVRVPFEDTQLAFYAALVRAESAQPLSAMYLALDGNTGIEEVPHKGVAESADALVQGLAHDLQRLRAGAGLPALGEGRTCEFCEARGVCRRDHWSPAEAAP